MSLKTRLGNLGNVLDEDASQCHLLQLESPVLSTAEFEAMMRTMGAGAVVVNCTFDAEEGETGPSPRHRTHPPRGRGGRARGLHPRGSHG